MSIILTINLKGTDLGLKNKIQLPKTLKLRVKEQKSACHAKGAQNTDILIFNEEDDTKVIRDKEGYDKLTRDNPSRNYDN